MRPCDSGYDRRFARATQELLVALRAAGCQVETPVTRSIIVEGLEISPNAWDRACTWYADGESVRDILAALQELAGR